MNDFDPWAINGFERRLAEPFMPKPTLVVNNSDWKAPVLSLAAARKPMLLCGGMRCENAYRLLAWAHARITLTDDEREIARAESEHAETENQPA